MQLLGIQANGPLEANHVMSQAHAFGIQADASHRVL